MQTRTWKLAALAVAVGAGALAGAARAAEAKKLSLRWYGQSAFVMKTPGGTTVVMDPIPGGIGYTLPKEKIPSDVVTISHEHPDHVNVDFQQGGKVLRGLTTPDGKEYAPKPDTTVKDVKISTVRVLHDDQGGAKFGKNVVFVFDTGGLRVVHLGDLGHKLTDAQVKELGKVDVLLIPTGGHYTIGPDVAAEVVKQLAPSRVIVPMHFKTPVLTVKELGPTDAFLAKFDTVRKAESHTLELDPAAKAPAKPDVVVLRYE